MKKVSKNICKKHWKIIRKVIQKRCQNHEKTIQKSMRKKYRFSVGRTVAGHFPAGEPLSQLNKTKSTRHIKTSHKDPQKGWPQKRQNPQSLPRLGRLKAWSGYVGPRALSGQACSSRRPRCPRVPRSGPPGPNIINIEIGMMKIKYVIKYKINYNIWEM